MPRVQVRCLLSEKKTLFANVSSNRSSLVAMAFPHVLTNSPYIQRQSSFLDVAFSLFSPLLLRLFLRDAANRRGGYRATLFDPMINACLCLVFNERQLKSLIEFRLVLLLSNTY